MDNIDSFGLKYISTSYCTRCQCDSLDHYENLYAIERWCSNCNYYSYSWHECCNSPNHLKVRYIYANESIHIREQCFTCGKLISGKAIKTNSIPANDISEFNQELFYQRESDIDFLKREFRKKKEYNLHFGYAEYLKSNGWHNIREKILERDNYLCQECKCQKATNIHHLNYDSICHEKTEDLISLCHNCHYKIHHL